MSSFTKGDVAKQINIMLLEMGSFVENGRAKKIDIMLLDWFAVERYKECPKFVTIVTHADRSDDSPIHCFLAEPFMEQEERSDEVHHRDFIVPEQTLILLQDEKYGLFSLLNVIESRENKAYWLFSSVTSRTGFIIKSDDLPASLFLTENEQMEEVAA